MFDKRFSLKKCLSQGMTWLVVIIISVLFAFVLFNWDSIRNMIGKIFKILTPVLFGLAIAYILNPVVDFLGKKLLHKSLLGRLKNERRAAGLARGSAVGLALAFLLLIFLALGYLVVPQIIKSVMDIINRLPEYSRDLIQWLNSLNVEDGQLSARTQQMILQASSYIQQWMESSLYPQLWRLVNGFTSSILNVFNFMYNLLIGVIISVYVLVSKEKFTGQAKKIVYALFRPETANAVIDVFRKSNQIFGGFISGKLIDSAIIGILCAIIMYILRLPYIALVSVIVGVTNVIPFFGPYIGAIPSIFLITLVSRRQGLIFLIMIVLLQQFDGNILGPKILGNSTGLSAFWVIFSILLGSGLFGFPGMLLGVPVFAVIYYLIKTGVEYLLYKRQMPLESRTYEKADSYDPVQKKMIYLPENETRREKRVREAEVKNVGITRDQLKRRIGKGPQGHEPRIKKDSKP